MTRPRGLLLVATLVALAACVRAGSVPEPPPMPADTTPSVVLISLDGFRWDYLDRPQAAHLRALAARGVRAERMLPSFPSKTFPNHYTLVTGLFPENHGIAANVMLDASLGRFRTGNDPAVRDARWFSGEPIWVTAERQGMRTAAYFWPGSEAPIGGLHPHWYYPFDMTTTRETRINRVLEWLAMPDSTRPRLIAVYFSDVDTDGHNFGPDSREVNEAIAHVDSAVGAIVDGIARQGRTSQVNVVVVADHGMTAVDAERVIALDEYVSMDSLDVGDWNPVATIIPKPGRERYVFDALRAAHPHLRVYRKGELPERLHYNRGARVTPIVAIADEGWSIGTRAELAKLLPGKTTGAHGYDNALPSMGALFVAAGPSFRQGVTVKPFTNVHVYPLLAQVLRLKPAGTDGSLDSVRAMLR